MIEITIEDAQNILYMSEKVQISGKEAMAVAQLQVKLSQGIKAEEDSKNVTQNNVHGDNVIDGKKQPKEEPKKASK